MQSKRCSGEERGERCTAGDVFCHGGGRKQLARRGGTRSVQEQGCPWEGNSLRPRRERFGTGRGDAAFVFWCFAGLVCGLGD